MICFTAVGCLMRTVIIIFIRVRKGVQMSVWPKNEILGLDDPQLFHCINEVRLK